ncbi:MAG: Flp family type IVb pilin [Hyphomonas sp.]|nr:Flp family type IVb pilin [Hyphomonas sp.]
MTQTFKRFVADESGATAVEYGLVTLVISVSIIGALTSIATNMNGKFNTVATTLSSS